MSLVTQMEKVRDQLCHSIDNELLQLWDGIGKMINVDPDLAQLWDGEPLPMNQSGQAAYKYTHANR